MDEITSPYERIGGAPTIAKLADSFYARVLEDPLLLPLFADPSEEHAGRMALWLTEVFGGPALHSERRGGLPRVVHAHQGLRISEQQRLRWVSHMLAATEEIEMPADVRSFWLGYVDQISKVTRNTSQSERPRLAGSAS